MQKGRGRRDFVRDGDKRSANTAMRRRARSVALGCAGLNIGHGRGERETGGEWWRGKERERKEGRDPRTNLSSSSISLPPLLLSTPLPLIKTKRILATDITFAFNLSTRQTRITSIRSKRLPRLLLDTAFHRVDVLLEGVVAQT